MAGSVVPGGLELRGNALVAAVRALGRGFVPRPELLYGLARTAERVERRSRDLLDQLAWTAVQPSCIPAVRELLDRSLPPEELVERLVFLRGALDVAAAGVPIRGAGGGFVGAKVRLLNEVAEERQPQQQQQQQPQQQQQQQQQYHPQQQQQQHAPAPPPSFRPPGARAKPPPPSPPAPAARPAPPLPRRVVSTGFATEGGKELVDRTLKASSRYDFFVEIGRERARGAIDDADIEVPVGAVPAGRVVRVAIFTFEGALACNPGADSGEFVFLEDGTLAVKRQPGAEPLEKPLGSRLRFPVTTADAPGVQRLRCNLYLDCVLLMSKLVSASVAAEETAQAGALRADTDFVFSGTLAPSHLRELRPHLLSLMLNDDGSGTHGFRLLGQDFKSDARLQDGDVKTLVEAARRRLRWVSWGDEQELDGTRKVAYRYEQPVPRDELQKHLFSLARAGRRAWDVLAERLAGSADAQQQLKALMRRPGRVQIVSKESARLVVPAAMFYDRPPRTALPDQELRLCQAFTAALDGPGPLEEAACFRGECPSLGDDRVMCPSGFWGFRHEIGMPSSIGADAAGASRGRNRGHPSHAAALDPGRRRHRPGAVEDASPGDGAARVRRGAGRDVRAGLPGSVPHRRAAARIPLRPRWLE